MAIFKKDTVVKSYPAVDYVTREKSLDGYINLESGDRLTSPQMRGQYEVSSSVAYALEYNEDPVAAYNDAVARGHETHWIIPLGVSLTAWKQDKVRALIIDLDATYRYEGRLFKIESRHNDNFGFVELTADELKEVS